MQGDISYLFWLIQCTGICAAILQILSCQFKQGRHIIACDIPSCLLWSLHLFLLGGMTGAATQLVAAARQSLIVFVHESWRPHIFAVSIAIVIGLGLYTWNGAISLLPMLGALCYTTTVILVDSGKLVRRAWIASTAFWMLYYILSGSPIGALTSALGLISALISMWRHDDVNIRLPSFILRRA